MQISSKWDKIICYITAYRLGLTQQTSCKSAKWLLHMHGIIKQGLDVLRENDIFGGEASVCGSKFYFLNGPDVH